MLPPVPGADPAGAGAVAPARRVHCASSDGIVICDPHQADCPIIYANPAFTATTGSPIEEVIGRNRRFLQGAGTHEQYVQQARDGLLRDTFAGVTGAG